MNQPVEPLSWSPSRGIALLNIVLLLGTAALLLWIGSVLGSDAVDAMDGFERVLFTLVPIRPFTWVMSVIMTALGLKVAHYAFAGEPSLRLDAGGLRFRDGTTVGWDDVEVLDPEHSATLRLTASAFMSTGSGRASRKARTTPDGRPVRELSSFDLGEDPRVVAREIERRRPELHGPQEELRDPSEELRDPSE